MQIRIVLFPLITSTFVKTSGRSLHDNAAIRIFMFLTQLFLAIKTAYLKLYFENILLKTIVFTLFRFKLHKQCAISLRNFI
jgi:hypothetical protein